MRIPINTELKAIPGADVMNSPRDVNNNVLASAQYLYTNYAWQPTTKANNTVDVRSLTFCGSCWNANIPTYFNFSVRFNQTAGLWQCVWFDNPTLDGYVSGVTGTTGFTPPSQVTYANFMAANSPYGAPGPPPNGMWSNHKSFTWYPFPQMVNPGGGQNPPPPNTYFSGIVCYGVQEHFDFETSDANILLTFNTNSAFSMNGTQNNNWINNGENPDLESYMVGAQSFLNPLLAFNGMSPHAISPRRSPIRATVGARPSLKVAPPAAPTGDEAERSKTWTMRYVHPAEALKGQLIRR